MKLCIPALLMTSSLLLIAPNVFAEAMPSEPNLPPSAHTPAQLEPFKQDVKDFLNRLTRANTEYMQNLSKENLKTFKNEQNPMATVVSCSDSRVQSDVFYNNPVDNLFFIRNIGNQIQPNEGSIEYGVEHLKTPVLMIIGHSHCGAVEAAMGSMKGLSKPIQKELEHMDLLKGNDVDEGVLANVHNQVQYAVNKYKDKIANNKLIVLGLVYDFRDDFGEGHGRMILIDVNGVSDPAKIREMAIVNGNDGIAIGENNVRKAPKPEKAPMLENAPTPEKTSTLTEDNKNSATQQN